MSKPKDAEEITQIVLEESKKLQKVINEELLPEFAKLHNISLDHNYFDAKQEVVASRAYFPGPKKKYSLRLCNMEGVPVDENEDKGLITRRSDYPPLTKQRIQEILDVLVKDEKVSFSKIKGIIETTRNEMLRLIKEGSKVLARPSSFTKPLIEYKTMPMHIKGMLMWNSLEYENFRPGTKGYLYRIKGVDVYKAPPSVLSRLENTNIANNIVIPEDVDVLPDYYEIDVDAMIQFAWDGRVDELIEPIIHNIYVEKNKDTLLTW